MEQKEMFVQMALNAWNTQKILTVPTWKCQMRLN